MAHVNLYLMTSFRSPSQKAGAYDYILEFPRDPVPATREQRGMLYHTTPNGAELAAALMALRRLKKGHEISLTIFTDNPYLDQIERARGWQEEGWSNGQKVRPNAAEWEELLQLLPEDTEIRVREKHSYHSWMKSTCKEEERNGKQKADDERHRDSQIIPGSKEQKKADRDPVAAERLSDQ